jgi:SAM-dependent methyltransferase
MPLSRDPEQSGRLINPEKSWRRNLSNIMDLSRGKDVLSRILAWKAGPEAPATRAAGGAGPDKTERRAIRHRLLDLNREVVSKRIKYHSAYQPIWMGKRHNKRAVRECEDRWAIVQETLLATNASSMLDLGCAEGYFVRRAGEMGCVAIGVDRDYNRLGLIEAARMFDRSKQSGFILGDIEPGFIAKLPSFDVVLCFSVMHHILRQNSLEHAREVLAAIASVTRKALVFDMGQSNETSTSWALKIPDMGANPEEWIRDFLKGSFREVETVGKTDAYRDPIARFVFRCKP